MVCWNRFISYIYRYHNNEKCENTGFAKVQKIAGNGRINIGLKDIVEKKDGTYLVYIYRETLADSDENHGNASQAMEHPVVIPKLLLLGRMKMRGGRGEGSFNFDWDNVMNSGRPITAWGGIIIRKNEQDPQTGYDGGRDMFCSSWTDSHVNYREAFLDNETEEEIIAGKQEIERKSEPEDRISVEQPMFGEEQMTEKSKMFVNMQTPVESRTFMETPPPVESRTFVGTPTSVEPQTFVGAQVPVEDQISGERKMEIPEEEDAWMDPEEAASSAVNPKEQKMVYENPAEELLATHERLPLLPKCDSVTGMDAEVFECVKISPNDIGLLDMSNWKLGVNSFLTHGYYHYKYLMLGKIMFQERNKTGMYILGVPGVYSSKEKYLANMFGFDRFIPCQETVIKTGSFGYWIVDLKS